MSTIDTEALRVLAEVEYADIVLEAVVPGPNTLRVILRDGSFIDVWYSLKLPDRYSFHWERRSVDGTIHRHDNAPHVNWRSVATFPAHFYDGDEQTVVASNLSADPPSALRQMLDFARTVLAADSPS